MCHEPNLLSPLTYSSRRSSPANPPKYPQTCPAFAFCLQCADSPLTMYLISTSPSEEHLSAQPHPLPHLRAQPASQLSSSSSHSVQAADNPVGAVPVFKSPISKFRNAECDCIHRYIAVLQYSHRKTSLFGLLG